MTYGIYDTQDDCWLGENETGTGPKTFDDPKVARLAAEIAAIQLGLPRGEKAGRIVVRPYDGSGTVLKDEVPTKDTPLNVLRKLERGVI